MRQDKLFCGVERLGGVIERLRQYGKLLLCAARIFALKRFVDSWNNYCRVACVFAGSIDGVAVPRPVGQSSRGYKRAFSLTKSVIQICRIAARCGLERVCLLSGGGEAGGGGLCRGEV